jgi:hypothetical protein
MQHVPRLFGLGIGAILLYDIWTNFGVWLGGWYSYSWSGLVTCFTFALPFMFWHLLSTTIAIAFVIVPILYLKEQNVNIPEFKINPLENKLTVAIPAVLMVLAVISILV